MNDFAETLAQLGVSDLARCMDPMLESLGSDDRIILQRIDMLGESQADVARELGMSMSGLKSRVQQARQRLREQLEDCCAIDRDGVGQLTTGAAPIGRVRAMVAAEPRGHPSRLRNCEERTRGPSFSCAAW